MNAVIAVQSSIARPQFNIFKPSFPTLLRFPRGGAMEELGRVTREGFAPFRQVRRRASNMLTPLAGTLTPLGVTQYVAAGLLLDNLSNIAAAYSFRKLRSAYSGSAIRIRRDSDNTEQDIGFSGTDFDAATAASFIGGGAGYLVTWYDQGGNSKNLTQATAGNQPLYVASAQNSKPAASFDGTNSWMDTPASVLSAQPFVFSSVGKETGSGDYQRMLSSTAGSETLYGVVSGQWAGYAGADLLSDTSRNSNYHIMNILYNGGSSVIRLDGSQIKSGNIGTNVGTAYRMGMASSGIDKMTGYVSEFIVFNTAQTMTTIETNQNTYWAVY